MSVRWESQPATSNSLSPLPLRDYAVSETIMESETKSSCSYDEKLKVDICSYTEYRKVFWWGKKKKHCRRNPRLCHVTNQPTIACEIDSFLFMFFRSVWRQEVSTRIHLQQRSVRVHPAMSRWQWACLWKRWRDLLELMWTEASSMHSGQQWSGDCTQRRVWTRRRRGRCGNIWIWWVIIFYNCLCRAMLVSPKNECKKIRWWILTFARSRFCNQLCIVVHEIEFPVRSSLSGSGTEDCDESNCMYGGRCEYDAEGPIGCVCNFNCDAIR